MVVSFFPLDCVSASILKSLKFECHSSAVSSLRDRAVTCSWRRQDRHKWPERVREGARDRCLYIGRDVADGGGEERESQLILLVQLYHDDFTLR